MKKLYMKAMLTLEVAKKFPAQLRLRLKKMDELLQLQLQTIEGGIPLFYKGDV
ncbi:hypothetical protein [Fusibacter ferrireducens]|uniref:Uncharacterized protein n=1 Tax=Fusibacter ferrireducens TaxID=2785058 RepID=A0ABR9ZS98_9FIRM|nr:hypothetical protein [Fusibacter ferrireducens]MBF4693338.1 hypothetical protein [Fusibacter ferrireducens]